MSKKFKFSVNPHEHRNKILSVLFPDTPLPKEMSQGYQNFICQQVKGNGCYNDATFEDHACKSHGIHKNMELHQFSP